MANQAAEYVRTGKPAPEYLEGVMLQAATDVLDNSLTVHNLHRAPEALEPRASKTHDYSSKEIHIVVYAGKFHAAFIEHGFCTSHRELLDKCKLLGGLWVAPASPTGDLLTALQNLMVVHGLTNAHTQGSFTRVPLSKVPTKWPYTLTQASTKWKSVQLEQHTLANHTPGCAYQELKVATVWKIGQVIGSLTGIKEGYYMNIYQRCRGVGQDHLLCMYSNIDI